MTIHIQFKISKIGKDVCDLRDAFVAYMFKTLSQPYLWLFKRRKHAWGLSKVQLLTYEKHTLAYKIGQFLDKNGFEIEAKMEEHDVFHVLSGTPTAVIDEIRLQYYMLGNGKRSVFLYIVLLTGLVLYVGQYRTFIKSFQKFIKLALSCLNFRK